MQGSVDTHGAKNAALPIMAATLLANGPVTLAPRSAITDVSVMWSLLEALGARLRLGRPTARSRSIRRNVASHRAPYTLVRKLAASFDLSGRCSAASARAEVPLPGGCILGTRATDMHEQAFRALGASVTNAHGYLVANADGASLRGADIEFRTPSVGATKNAMLAAVLADGTTTMRNVAMEPEVVDLANFLVAMGAKHRRARHRHDRRSTACASCTGVDYEIIPDRIVAGTLLIAGAATRGDVTRDALQPAASRGADAEARGVRRRR